VIRPTDFLDIANRFHNAPTEAERRTAIGRAYYSLYNLLIDFLATSGIPLPGGGDNHAAVVYYLTRSGDAAADTIGQALKTLRWQRNQADYDLWRAIDVRHSTLAFGLAHRQFVAFQGLPPAALAAFVSAVKRLGVYRPPS
jgi:hypothetical protein